MNKQQMVIAFENKSFGVLVNPNGSRYYLKEAEDPWICYWFFTPKAPGGILGSGAIGQVEHLKDFIESKQRIGFELRKRKGAEIYNQICL